MHLLFVELLVLPAMNTQHVHWLTAAVVLDQHLLRGRARAQLSNARAELREVG